MGLPGTGKTTLAAALADKLKAVWFNADVIRQHINKDLGFSNEDRIEQAKRMGILCDIVNNAGHIAIADFVCPTNETRKAFGKAFVIYISRTPVRNFTDTTNIFEPPLLPDVIVPDGLTVDEEVSLIEGIVNGLERTKEG